MAVPSRALKTELIELASDFEISAASRMSKVELKELIMSNSAYTEDHAKGMLNAIPEGKERERKAAEGERKGVFELEKLKIERANGPRETSPPISDESF